MDDITIHQQIDMFGVDAVLAGAASKAETSRILAASAVMQEDLAAPESRMWTHSAFCMTGLPHRRPNDDDAIWHRANGHLHLLVESGSIIDHGRPRKVGVPFGAKARLILFYIQTHAGDDGMVVLGPSLSAWMRKIGLEVIGGPRGTLAPFREQLLRLSRSRISLHWTDSTDTSHAILDRTAVDSMSLWAGDPCDKWEEFLHLSPTFLSALKQHHVPLCAVAIGHLRTSSLALDLYAWLAYRLSTLKRPTLIKWYLLAAQLGAEFTRTADLAAKIRAILPDVLAVYPGAKVEVTPHGLRIFPSPPAILGGGSK